MTQAHTKFGSYSYLRREEVGGPQLMELSYVYSERAHVPINNDCKNAINLNIQGTRPINKVSQIHCYVRQYVNTSTRSRRTRGADPTSQHRCVLSKNHHGQYGKEDITTHWRRENLQASWKRLIPSYMHCVLLREYEVTLSLLRLNLPKAYHVRALAVCGCRI